MRIKQMLYADSSLGKVQAVFSAKVKHRARVQLTIGQRTRVFPGVAREPVADHWLSRGTRARGAKPFFSAASAKSQACPKHFHGVEIKLGVERALDVGGLAEAMLLTREQEIAHWCPAVSGRPGKLATCRCASQPAARRKMSFNPARQQFNAHR
jgi:hypothetical protein